MVSEPTVRRMDKTLIRCRVRGEESQLSGRSTMKARRLIGGRYEKTASDLTPSTVLTTRWNRCCSRLSQNLIGTGGGPTSS